MHVTSERSYPKQVNWFTTIRDWMNSYNINARSGHFWIIQGLVITITVLHVLVAKHIILPTVNCSDFFPATLFFVPVIYAALKFGFTGSLGTALEALILFTPGLVLFHHGLTMLGLGLQFVFVIAGAAFLGYWVDQERTSRQRAKTYAVLLTNAHEKERQRIARDLHDDSIQNMVLLCRELDEVNRSQSLPLAPREKLLAARKTAEQEVISLRNVTRNLRPPILDDFGIVEAIRRVQTDLMERTGADGKLEVSGKERRLKSELEVGLFRIAQEALSNVEHHSNASAVVVTVGFTNKEINLTIKDNGKGFTRPVYSNVSADGGLGILGMEERAELLDGKLEIQSSRGKGTTVTAKFPLYSELSSNVLV